MASNVMFSNQSGSPVYATLFFSCPVPNKISSLAMEAMQAQVNMNLNFMLPQPPYAFTWAKYNPKRKGIFTADNQVPCYWRSSNVISFSNAGEPHFLNQTGAPIDECNIIIDKTSVRNNYFYGGFCLGNRPIFAQIMQPGDTQRYPAQMDLMFGYSYQPIEMGQVIDVSVTKTLNLAEYSGGSQIYIRMDSNGHVSADTQQVSAAATS